MLTIRKKFFTLRVVRCKSRLPWEVVNAPGLAVFKARLHKTLSNPIWWRVALPTMAGSDWMIFKLHPKTLIFCDSMTLHLLPEGPSQSNPASGC